MERTAIAEHKTVVEVDAKHTAAHYNLAMAYEKLDPREAIAQWDRYIGIASFTGGETVAFPPTALGALVREGAGPRASSRGCLAPSS